MSVDPNGDPRDSRRGPEGGCCHPACRAGTNIDRAIARAGTTGENEGYALPADGTVVADHEVAPVQDVDAWLEVERPRSPRNRCLAKWFRSSARPVGNGFSCIRDRPEPLSKPLRGSRKGPRPDPEGQDAPWVNCSAADQGVDLGVFRKPAELFLRESEPAIDGDLENTGNPFNELDLLGTSFHKPCPRTEGPWFIVSGHAIFNSDLHCRHL